MDTSIITDKQPISTKQRAALAYADKLNWAVLPLHYIKNGQCSCKKRDCGSAGKHPLINGGLNNATTDQNIIYRWFQQWPDANIGIRTGEESGFVAVDIDPRHGGVESFDDLLREHGNIPDTVEAETGSGGRHILFKYPNVPTQNKANLVQGVDIRGDGGYIVVAPSNHMSGNEYGWEFSSHPLEVPIADMPEWLFIMIAEPSNGVHKKKSAAHWANLLQGVGEGERNMSAASLAGYLLRRRIDPIIAYELVILWNERCKPPDSIEEVTKTFNSILKKETGRLARRG